MMMTPFSSLPTSWITGGTAANTVGPKAVSPQTGSPVKQNPPSLSLARTTQGFTSFSLPNTANNWLSPIRNWFNFTGQTVSNALQALGQASSVLSFNLPGFGPTSGTAPMSAIIDNNQKRNAGIISNTTPELASANSISP